MFRLTELSVSLCTDSGVRFCDVAGDDGVSDGDVGFGFFFENRSSTDTQELSFIDRSFHLIKYSVFESIVRFLSIFSIANSCIFCSLFGQFRANYFLCVRFLFFFFVLTKCVLLIKSLVML